MTQHNDNLPEGARELPQPSGLAMNEIGAPKGVAMREGDYIPIDTIRVGSVVQEIGSTTRMTVREIVLDGYVCDWFVGNDLHTDKFAPGALRLAPPLYARAWALESSPEDMHVEAIARVAHEANRAYCVTIGDLSQVEWTLAPSWQRDSARLGVRKILAGEVTRPEQSHESWLAEKRAEGWQYGPVKDPEKKEHPCFVPYEALSIEQRYKDHLFLAVVRALGTKIG
jgi:uncharacterized protein YodC (DUF2158 family)